jgi:hypothetical protein
VSAAEGDLRPAAHLRSGHPEISWSIVLDLALEHPVDPAEATGRLRAGWPDQDLGPSPQVTESPPAAATERLEAMADRPYPLEGPRCRIEVVTEPSPRLRVAAHHGYLDGLGTLAAASLALARPLATTITGIGAGFDRGPAGPAYVARRSVEALLVPPARFAPDRRTSELGDHLLELTGPATSVSTPEVIAAATRALVRWNDQWRRRARRIVVAVGASRRPGSRPTLAEESAWFRFRVVRPDPAVIRRTLERAAPEPAGSASMTGRVASRMAELLSQRTGSSMLLSNLGRVEDAAPILSGAFYPAVHGRSGIGVGVLTVNDTLTLTLRARRSAFTRDAAETILRSISEELAVGLAP